MGMYAAQNGNYTFALDKRSDLSKVQEVWLHDATSNTYTNLMEADYTFATTKTESAGRFYISVKLAPKVATGMENVNANSIWANTNEKDITIHGLLTDAQIWIYDAAGKLVVTDNTQYFQHTYTMPQAGAYFVAVQNARGKQTIKVVVE